MPESSLETKKQLRQQAKALRETLDISSISNAICTHLGEWPVFLEAEQVLAYSALAYEISLAELIKNFPHKQWYFPRVVDETTITFHRYALNDKLITNALGILEPLATCPSFKNTSNTLILIPALMLDKHGNRLGFGKGYYDRFLSTLSCQATLAVPIAEKFLVQKLPYNIWDVPVHYAITEARVLPVAIQSQI